MHKLSSSQKIFSFFFHIGGFPLFTTTTGSLYAQPEKRPGKSAQRQLTHCFSSSLKFSSIPKKWFFKLQNNLSLSPAPGCDRTRKNASRRVRKKCTSLSPSSNSCPRVLLASFASSYFFTLTSASASPRLSPARKRLFSIDFSW